MICTNCHSSVEAGERFCGECGQPVQPASDKSATQDTSRDYPRPIDGNLFLMPIEEVFGLGPDKITVLGYITRGEVRTGQVVEIIGHRGARPVRVSEIKTWSQQLQSAEGGMNVGCVLKGILGQEVEKGMVLAAPGSISTHREFEAEINMLKAEEGGRTLPVDNNSQPDVFVWACDLPARIRIRGGAINPGATGRMSITLPKAMPLEVGQRIILREKGRTFAAGTITTLFD
jgi:elongation factor Tu